MLNYARKVAKEAVYSVLNARDKRGVQGYGQSPGHWDLESRHGGGLSWDGVELSEMADRYGTPLHVVSRSRLEKDFRGFRHAFASRYPRVDVSYSYKTNPLPGVIQELHALGAGAEVISYFELWLALKLGVPPQRIIFNGPSKSPDALALAVSSGVKLINIDNFTEIEALERITNGVDRRQPVAVRLVTSVGWSGQFGMKIADGTAREAFRRLSTARGLWPCGVHIHLGNGLRDTSTYTRAAAEVTSFIKSVQAEFGIRIEHLDMGGGFGVPTVRPFTALDQRLLLMGYPAKPPVAAAAATPDDYAREITQLIKTGLGCSEAELPELILEPGRAVTSGAQLLLLRVVAMKAGDEVGPYAILDGGKNVAMPTGYEYHEVLPVDRPRDEDLRTYTLFGPLCHPGDILVRYRQLPKLELSSLVAVMDAGAYFIPNQMNFSNPRPAVVMVHKGQARVLREREDFEGIVRLDRIEAVADRP